jgi:hypothetical protein
MYLRLDRVWDKKLNMISEFRDNFGRRVFLFRLGKDELHYSASIPFFRINSFLRNQFLSSESIPFSFYQNQSLSSELIPFFRINSFLQTIVKE